MGNTQDFSNIKCNVLSSTQKKSADLDTMPNTVQTKHRSCHYCLYHRLSIIPSGSNLCAVLLLTKAKSNWFTTLTIDKTVAVTCMHKKQPNFSPLYVHQLLVINTQWSDFPCTTTAKVKPILMGRQQYHHEHLKCRLTALRQFPICRIRVKNILSDEFCISSSHICSSPCNCGRSSSKCVGRSSLWKP